MLKWKIIYSNIQSTENSYKTVLNAILKAKSIIFEEKEMIKLLVSISNHFLFHKK